jgi:hypothetical protein
MSLLKLWFIRNPVLVSYSICMRQGSSDLSGYQSALACLCVCARVQLGLREFNMAPGVEMVLLKRFSLLLGPQCEWIYLVDIQSDHHQLLNTYINFLLVSFDVY